MAGIPASAAMLVTLVGLALLYFALTNLGLLKPKDTDNGS